MQTAEDDAEQFNELMTEAMFGTFARHIGAVVAQRRTAPLDPDEDMISGALIAEIDGAALTDGQIAEIGVQMIAAGFFTTAKALGAAIFRVATVP